jgi:hypothetical protein
LVRKITIDDETHISINNLGLQRQDQKQWRPELTIKGYFSIKIGDFEREIEVFGRAGSVNFNKRVSLKKKFDTGRYDK